VDNITKKKVSDLSSALNCLGAIKQRAEHKQLAVFLDYDGTLTPIVERPERALLSAEARHAVLELAEVCTVAVLSGRDLRDVQNLVRIDHIFFAGSHGFDIGGPSGWHIQNQTGLGFLPALDEAERELRDRLDTVAGALVERKKFSIAVHFRLVDEKDAERVEQLVDQVLAGQSRLRKGYGKKVFELQPKIDWHKGKALLWLLETLGLDGQGVLPVYLGDDVTDEDAFEALADRGIGIFVKGSDGPGETVADYALEDCEEVRRFLIGLTELLQSAQKSGNS